MYPVTELIDKAIEHLLCVGLRKGKYGNVRGNGRATHEVPVCGVGALRYVIIGKPWDPIKYNNPYFKTFCEAVRVMNEAAEEIDWTLPHDVDSFMMYNDDPNTSLDDVIQVMNRAKELL